MIHVQEVTKEFGNVRAVNHLSFSVPDGAITGLLGNNGAGKTTTLRIIAGVLQANEGSVRIDGQNARTAQARVGALLDHAGLYPRLSVRENLLYFAHLRGFSGTDACKHVDGAIARLQLESIADRKVSGISQGQYMRTALARSMVHLPRNVILDEPTNGLDVPSVRELRAFLRKLRDDGCCVLFSSHVLQEVAEICDTVVMIARGTLVAEGRPAELQTRTGTATLEDAFLRITQKETAPQC